MTSRLTANSAASLAMVGETEGKAPRSLAAVMPSRDHAAMVGKGKTPGSLAERMPSAAIAAKVGKQEAMTGITTHRLVRLKAQD